MLAFFRLRRAARLRQGFSSIKRYATLVFKAAAPGSPGTGAKGAQRRIQAFEWAGADNILRTRRPGGRV